MIEIFKFDDKVEKISLDVLKATDKVWIDMNNITLNESEKIKEKFNLHPLVAEDLLNSPIRVKVEEFEGYLFSIFYGIKNNKKIELIEIDFILGKNFIITNHKKQITSFEELKRNEEKLLGLMKKGPDFLFHRLLDKEVDNFFPILEKIDDNIEEIEERVTVSPKSKDLSEILALKREVVQIRKIGFQQREKISFLAKNDYDEISKKAIPYFRDVYDHMIRVSDMLDNYRELISNTFDAYMSAVSNNMNEVMKVLSIIATIALPLTVISGIYGTNFSILPGATNNYGFWLMVLAMIFTAMGMMFFFKKRNWF